MPTFTGIADGHSNKPFTAFFGAVPYLKRLVNIQKILRHVMIDRLTAKVCQWHTSHCSMEVH